MGGMTNCATEAALYGWLVSIPDIKPCF